ncbi:MAG TPA: hypothetical protein VGM98_20685 [Schlesneria sp.]
MNGDIYSLIFAIVFVPMMVLGWLLILDRLRIRRVRRAYSKLTVETRDQILNLIDQAGRERFACSVLVADTPNSDPNSADVTATRYGGSPYAEAGETWPDVAIGKPTPADFLIQVRLDETFSAPWVGRLVVVFNRFDVEQTVRCYATPSAQRSITLLGGPALQKEWSLLPVRIPIQIGVESSTAEPQETNPAPAGLLDYDPVVLLESVPELTPLLIARTSKPADLLAAILAPNHASYGFELSDLVQLGGQPVWLIEDAGPRLCHHCGKAMRFLFQFGDLNGGIALGDAGVCYVFGCDEHPDDPFGIVQMS